VAAFGLPACRYQLSDMICNTTLCIFAESDNSCRNQTSPMYTVGEKKISLLFSHSGNSFPLVTGGKKEPH
jgi:hypothetical protein